MIAFLKNLWATLTAGEVRVQKWASAEKAPVTTFVTKYHVWFLCGACYVAGLITHWVL